MRTFAVLLLALGAGIVTMQMVYPSSRSSSAQEAPSAGEPTAVAIAPADEAPSRASSQLEVNPSDIVVAPDGKLSVPDRGDGCKYAEVARGDVKLDVQGDGNRAATEIVVLQDASCDIFYWFLPSIGETMPLIAVVTP